jgi:hypothetical protein
MRTKPISHLAVSVWCGKYTKKVLALECEPEFSSVPEKRPVVWLPKNRTIVEIQNVAPIRSRAAP